ncbi:hypothetical protein OPKNFCMD_2541 [Methylobacterium crusticola]|uniref:Uncharacterized protein n=1 Tax=Methylobacterium crusticola TaxID=1697972 RepID=A0ABQ4QZ15_9HYPH|nr:hypothetical protein [Methylobacterium crusticola]GJD49807.1 hypothetical protein OPKNFCMD_2541 [Methylobacterium crusticola]
MTHDPKPPATPAAGEGLANDSVGASRRPAGHGAEPAAGAKREPASGTPQGGRPADEQIPKE